MFTTVTVKVEAESPDELIKLGAGFIPIQAHFDRLWNSGVFGDPDHTEVRYLVIGGDYRKGVENVGPSETVGAVAERTSGTDETVS